VQNFSFAGDAKASHSEVPPNFEHIRRNVNPRRH
jgi:hypothetical protein